MLLCVIYVGWERERVREKATTGIQKVRGIDEKLLFCMLFMCFKTTQERDQCANKSKRKETWRALSG